MPDPVTEEVLVTGGDWSNPGDDWMKIQEAYQRAAEQFANSGYTYTDAFAPPTPVVLPEVIVQPPPRVAPPVIPPAVPSLLTQLSRVGLGFLSVLVPGSMGGAGEGDAPDESSSVARRGQPPKEPPRIDPVFEDVTPPDWDELSRGGKSDLLDTLTDKLIPFPIPPVEMPQGEKYFDVSPPQPRPNPFPDLWSFPDVGPNPELQPFPTGPGPGPAPAPIGTPGVDPYPGLPDPGDVPEPRRSPQPDAPGSPAPDVFGAPLPDGIGDPIGDPFTTPTQPPGTRPDPTNPVRTVPRDTPGTVPNPFVTPGPGPDGWAAPDFDVEPFPDPLLADIPRPPGTKKDTCTCDEPKKKKKPKKDARTVCYRGTYRQLKRGITYKKLEEVPCEAPTRKDRKPRIPKSLPNIFSVLT